jgi:modification methylase
MNKIFNETCQETLKKIPDNFIDLTITSPPYNKKEGKNQGILVKKVKYDSFSDVLPEEEYQSQQIEVMNSIYEKTKEGGSFFYNHKMRWDRGDIIHPFHWIVKTKWKVRQEIVWNRGIASNIRGFRFWNTDERIYWLYKPVGENLIGEEMKSRHSLMTSIWNIRPEIKNKDHPAPYPVKLPTRIIYSMFDIEKDKVIYDPYMGSGTTAVAAKYLGHNYLGSEISEAYLKIANDRIENQWTDDAKNIQEEMNLHVVNKTWKDRKAEKDKWSNE